MSRNRDVSLHYIVSDYDPKQYVKTFFLKSSCFCFFKAHSIFFGCSQLRNQKEGVKGASAPLATPKKQAFERVLDLNVSIRGLKGLGNLILSMTF